MDITATYALQSREAVAGTLLARRRAIIGNLVNGAVILVLGVILLFSGPWWVMLGAGVCGLGLASLTAPYLAIYRAASRTPHVLQRRTLRLTTTELRSTAPSLELGIPWSAALVIHENKAMWVIQLGASLAVTVPKRALSRADQATFAAFLAARAAGQSAATK